MFPFIQTYFLPPLLPNMQAHTLHLVYRKRSVKTWLRTKDFGKTNWQLFFALKGLDTLFLKVTLKGTSELSAEKVQHFKLIAYLQGIWKEDRVGRSHTRILLLGCVSAVWHWQFMSSPLKSVFSSVECEPLLEISEIFYLW